jgi:hypothetical protein
VTKQKGFGSFDVAGYWIRKYRGKVDDESWYLLTNLGELKPATPLLLNVAAVLKLCSRAVKRVVTI